MTQHASHPQRPSSGDDIEPQAGAERMHSRSNTRARWRSIALVALAAFAAACGSTEHGNPDGVPSDPPGDGMLPSDGPGMFGNYESIPGCSHLSWTAPDAPRLSFACDAEHGPFGQLTEPIWECDCDGELRQGALHQDQTCDDALRDICELGEPTREFCQAPNAGLCWPGDAGDDAWDCACGDPEQATELALETLRAERCEQAAFARCATPCQDALGRCVPDPEAGIFECDCDYFAAPRRLTTQVCADALAHCDPARRGEEPDGTPQRDASCESLAGHCDVGEEQVRCVCVDGEERELSRDTLPEVSNEGCSEALYEGCGDGRAQREAMSCAEETDAGRLCDATLDLRAGEYACHCHSENACNEEYDFHDRSYSGDDCDQALAACIAEDADKPRSAEPQCTPSSGASSCDSSSADGHFCAASRRSDQEPFACQCFTQLDESQDEADIWDTTLEASDCETALASCASDYAAR